MSLVLEANQKCPHSDTCPYNVTHECWGAKPDRPHIFNCSYVDNGQILEGKIRSPLDKTGNMKVLID